MFGVFVRCFGHCCPGKLSELPELSPTLTRPALLFIVKACSETELPLGRS